VVVPILAFMVLPGKDKVAAGSGGGLNPVYVKEFVKFVDLFFSGSDDFVYEFV